MYLKYFSLSLSRKGLCVLLVFVFGSCCFIFHPFRVYNKMIQHDFYNNIIPSGFFLHFNPEGMIHRRNDNVFSLCHFCIFHFVFLFKTVCTIIK